MAKQLLYCLLTHNSPKQTLRLLQAIYNEHDQFIIHVDQAASADYRALIARITQGLANLRVVSTRTCSWGGFSLVRATLDMHVVGMATNPNWSHALLLSATHLPVWSAERIRRWLHDGVSVLGWYDSPPAGDAGWLEAAKSRIEWEFVEKQGEGNIRGAYLGEPEFRYYKGPQWHALSREHIKYVLGRNQDSMFHRLSRSHVPDEAFFQTILLNSDFRQTCRNEWATTDIWKPNSWNPEIIDLEGYRDAIADPKSPFVRKIAEDIADEDAMKTLIGVTLRCAD